MTSISLGHRVDGGNFAGVYGYVPNLAVYAESNTGTGGLWQDWPVAIESAHRFSAPASGGRMAEVVPDLSLKELISAISEELLASQQERILAGRPALFELAEVTLEVSFVVTHSKSGGGGFDFHVIKADSNIKYDTESVQKATMKLSPLKMSLPDGTFGTVRPALGDDTRP